MDESYLISQLNKHTERITGIEVSIKYLSGSIDKLSESIEKLAARVENKKGLGTFLRDNWFRIPTMLVLLYGAVWTGNYINDNFIPENSKYRNSN